MTVVERDQGREPRSPCIQERDPRASPSCFDPRPALIIGTWPRHESCWRGRTATSAGAQELLSRYLASEDVYFDSVSRIRVSSWSRGRVTLLGDAASCLSLFGDGSSSAIEGAATLAASLNASPHEIPAALARYESAHRRATRPRQRNVWIASHLLIPSSQLGITLREQGLRLARRGAG